MEGSREYMLDTVKAEKTLAFEKIFEVCADRVHAIFLFLSMLELIQAKYMFILVGEGRNNFIIEWNEERPEEISLPLS
jgi:segregation and condensation protein A